jgi:hypothetical protein
MSPDLMPIACIAYIVPLFDTVKLSFYPLATNPSVEAIQRAWYNTASFLYANDLRSSALTTVKGRRWQCPTIPLISQNVFCSSVAGFIVHFTAVEPMLRAVAAEDPFASSAILAACVISTLATWIPLLDGVSHEIDPITYLDFSDSRWFDITSSRFLRQIGSVVIGVPVVAAAASMLFFAPITPTSWASLYLRLAAASALIATVSFVFEETLRVKLFHPLPNIDLLVLEAHGSLAAEKNLSIIVASLLESKSLTDEVLCPSHHFRIGTPEYQELKLSESWIRQMADVFLQPVNPSVEMTFEEDVLRVLVLESFGGRSWSARRAGHQATVCRWIDPKRSHRETSREPASTVVVRALYVFVGGFGEALTNCAAAANRWKISPTAFTAMEFAVIAIERCLVQSLSPSGQTRNDWRGSHLAAQVPSALQAVFRLRCGFIKFVQATELTLPPGESSATIPRAKADDLVQETNYPIVKICDTAASKVLLSMKELGRVDQSLDRDCLLWAKSLLN